MPVVGDERREHDVIVAAVRAWPDRFTGAMSPHLYQPDDCFRDEVRRCVETRGLRALKIQPQFSGLNPMGKRAEWVFGIANDYRLPVVFHTGSGATFALPSLLIPVARQYPEPPVSVAHRGGPTCYLEAIVPARLCPNLLLDVSSLMPHQVLEVLRHVPAERVMARSDPPESAEVELGEIVSLPVSDGVKRAVLWDTPRNLLKNSLFRKAASRVENSWPTNGPESIGSGLAMVC
ncbi:MAG: amidohydrolase family protein [Acidobacteriota bacterium]